MNAVNASHVFGNIGSTYHRMKQPYEVVRNRMRNTWKYLFKPIWTIIFTIVISMESSYGKVILISLRFIPKYCLAMSNQGPYCHAVNGSVLKSIQCIERSVAGLRSSLVFVIENRGCRMSI